MLRQSHLIVGTAGWGAATYTALTRSSVDSASMALALSCAVVGSVGPDADLTFPLRLVTAHRGVTHSLLATLVVTVVVYAAASSMGLHAVWVAAGAGWGWLSHLLADTCTPGGVPYLWPSKRRYSWDLFPTGAFRERLLVAVWVAACVVAVVLQARSTVATQAQP